MSAETVLPAPLVALAAEIGRYLQQQQQVLACAESCTGGLVASALTAIAGSSAWFSCGWVTYANAAKMQQLHVPEALLTEQGAVSEAVARAMAEGALRQAGADVALAISATAAACGRNGTHHPFGQVFATGEVRENSGKAEPSAGWVICADRGAQSACDRRPRCALSGSPAACGDG